MPIAVRFPGRRRVRISTALGLIAFAVPLMAQAPATPPRTTPASKPPAAASPRPDAALPTARAVIDRHIAAIGGRAAVLARTSARATGTVSVPSAGMNGTIEVFTAKPNKTLLKITLGGVGSIEEGYDGTIGWSMSPMTGPTLVQGKELEQKRFDADFYADLHDNARFESMTTVEKTTFEGRPCYKLRLVRRGGGEDFEFYDAETGLKAGGITTRESPMGPITATSIESGYKKFGSLLQPTVMKQTAMGLQQVITLDTIEYDTVKGAVFEPPAAIKALVK